MGEMRDRMEKELKLRGLSQRTSRCYLRVVENYIRHHNKRPAEQMGGSGSGRLAPPGTVESTAAMSLSLMVLFLCFTVLSQGRGFVYPAGALRYNHRHEIVVEILDWGQFSSRSGILGSGQRLAGRVDRGSGIARVAPASD